MVSSNRVVTFPKISQILQKTKNFLKANILSRASQIFTSVSKFPDKISGIVYVLA